MFTVAEAWSCLSCSSWRSHVPLVIRAVFRSFACRRRRRRPVLHKQCTTAGNRMPIGQKSHLSHITHPRTYSNMKRDKQKGTPKKPAKSSPARDQAVFRYGSEVTAKTTIGRKTHRHIFTLFWKKTGEKKSTWKFLLETLCQQNTRSGETIPPTHSQSCHGIPLHWIFMQNIAYMPESCPKHAIFHLKKAS